MAKYTNDLAIATPGSTVWLPVAPLFINIEVLGANTASWPRGASLLGDQVVIPLVSAADKVALTFPGIVSATMKRHPAEFRFVLTYHKSQGQTFDRVVLDV
jgi:hypothetical protein